MNRKFEGICDRIIIYLDDKERKFNIIDIKRDSILFFGLKDLEIAIRMKEAYCFGYIDGKNEESE